MQLFFSLPKSSSIQRHFSAILVKKPTTKMNSIAFTQNDIVLQLQLQSKPWKLLHPITDKTQVSFRQFACGDFHPHLKKKEITVRLPGEKIYRGYYMAARRYEFYLFMLKVSLTSERSERVRNTFSARR